MNAEKWLSLLEKIRYNQAPYQPQMICHLLRQTKHTDTKTNIAEFLQAENPKVNTYGKGNPVFKVLRGKKMVTESGENWSISAKLTPTQKAQAQAFCKGVLN